MTLPFVTHQRLRFLSFLANSTRLAWAAAAAHRFAARTALAPRAATLKVATLTRGVCEPAKSLALRGAQRGADSASCCRTDVSLMSGCAHSLRPESGSLSQIGVKGYAMFRISFSARFGKVFRIIFERKRGHDE